MGSRTLKQLARSGLIVPVDISDEQQGMYQPGILNTVQMVEKLGASHMRFQQKLYLLTVV